MAFLGIAQIVAQEVGESVIFREGWRCDFSQMTLGRTCWTYLITECCFWRWIYQFLSCSYFSELFKWAWYCDHHALECASILLRHVRREWALLSFHSVCLTVCRSFRDLQPTTIDWSQPLQIWSDPCKPFWIPYLPYFRCKREKYATRILATANVTHHAIWLVFLAVFHFTVPMFTIYVCRLI